MSYRKREELAAAALREMGIEYSEEARLAEKEFYGLKGVSRTEVARRERDNNVLYPKTILNASGVLLLHLYPNSASNFPATRESAASASVTRRALTGFDVSKPVGPPPGELFSPSASLILTMAGVAREMRQQIDGVYRPPVCRAGCLAMEMGDTNYDENGDSCCGCYQHDSAGQYIYHRNGGRELLPCPRGECPYFLAGIECPGHCACGNCVVMSGADEFLHGSTTVAVKGGVGKGFKY